MSRLAETNLSVMAPSRKKQKKEPPPKLMKVEMSALLQTMTCSITLQLIVDPVVAEDGQIYEREALKRWMVQGRKSPSTNASMGPKVLDLRDGRTLVQAAIDGGGVADEDAVTWYLASARRAASGALPGGPGAARNYLDRAARMTTKARDASLVAEIALLRRAVAHREQGDALLAEAATEGVTGVDEILNRVAAAVVEDPNAPMKEFRYGIQGKCIRIVDDDELFEELCRRPAPGASEGECEWEERMADMCGVQFIVEECDVGLRAYRVYYDGDYPCVPFDACIFVGPSD